MTDRDLVLKLRRIEAEESARRDCPINTYNTEKVHEKQMQFHRATQRNRWVFGGNRSGKTECGAVEAIWLARGIHPYRPNKPNVFGWVVSVSYEVQRDVAQSKIFKYLRRDWIVDVVMQEGRKDSPESGVVDFVVIKNVFGGVSKIGFKSCDQGREKFQGASLDFVWFDEEPPQEIYEECKMRLLDKAGDMFGTMTPLKGLTWVYEQIYCNSDDPEIWYVQIEWDDNPYLPPEEVAALKQSMSDEQQESRRFGRFCQGSGPVYGEFSIQKHVIDPFPVPKEWYNNISIDPGLNNPLSAHFYAVDGDDNIYVIAEHYEKGKTVDYHSKKLFLLADSLGWHRDSKGRLCALIDSAANQRTLAASKSVSELFFDNSILVNTNVNKDLFSGIARVKSLFSQDPPRIFIFKNCVNLIRELKGYRWGSGDVPIKRDDHALDELRYFVMSNPRFDNDIKTQKTAIQKDKEKLIRAVKRSYN